MKKSLKIALIIILLIIISMAIIKSITNEDDWICEKGKWIKHGVPYAEKPPEPCEENLIQRVFS